MEGHLSGGWWMGMKCEVGERENVQGVCIPILGEFIGKYFGYTKRL